MILGDPLTGRPEFAGQAEVRDGDINCGILVDKTFAVHRYFVAGIHRAALIVVPE